MQKIKYGVLYHFLFLIANFLLEQTPEPESKKYIFKSETRNGTISRIPSPTGVKYHIIFILRLDENFKYTNKLLVIFKYFFVITLTYGRSSCGAIPLIMTKYRIITFKLFGQHKHSVDQTFSISLGCSSANWKLYTNQIMIRTQF